MTANGADLTGPTGCTVVTIASVQTGVVPTPNTVTTAITFSPALGAATSAYADDDLISFYSQRLEIKIGEGNCDYTEKLEYKYDLERGNLDAVREGNEVPVEMKFECVYEHITTGTGEQICPMDALKGINGAAEWVTSGPDPSASRRRCDDRVRAAVLRGGHRVHGLPGLPRGVACHRLLQGHDFRGRQVQHHPGRRDPGSADLAAAHLSPAEIPNRAGNRAGADLSDNFHLRGRNAREDRRHRPHHFVPRIPFGPAAGRHAARLPRRGLKDMSEFSTICPAPKPPGKLTKDGFIPNTNDPSYQQLLTMWGTKRLGYMAVKSLEPSEITWDTVDIANPATWGNWETDLKNGGLNQFEVNRVTGLVLEANSLDDDKIERARRIFLLGSAGIRTLWPPTELASTSSGEPAKG